MTESAALPREISDTDVSLAEVFERERKRLLAYVRRRVPEWVDPEDILQDVFFELLESYRAVKPVANTGAWLITVAKNRITDLFRRRSRDEPVRDSDRILESLLPDLGGGTEAMFARKLLFEEIEAALGELPPEQREVFLAHEVDGRSFAEIANQTGVSVNTLLSRKHYAVRRLRKRLQAVYDELEAERTNR